MAIVMICGSRDAPFTLGEVAARICEHIGPDDTMLCGMARGIDLFCWRYAMSLGCEMVDYPPDDRLPSPAKFHARNDAMLRDCEQVVAFWDRQSRGTKSVIEKALKRGLPLFVYDCRTGAEIPTG